jgi:hypothetical protein
MPPLSPGGGSYSLLLCCCYFVLPPPTNTGIALPLHANVSGDGWTCNTGYFRTAPYRWLALPTCRACTPVTTSAMPYSGQSSVDRHFFCPLGSGIVPCTPDADATCAPCPALPSGYVHTLGGDCAESACKAEGYYHYSSFSQNTGAIHNFCYPCPVGFYCQGGIAVPCGDNCTTEKVRAAHACLSRCPSLG